MDNRKFIWATTKNGFRMLWIWRICLILCTEVEDNRKIGIWKQKYGRLFFIGKYGVGIGHSIGTNILAYKKD